MQRKGSPFHLHNIFIVARRVASPWILGVCSAIASGPASFYFTF